MPKKKTTYQNVATSGLKAKHPKIECWSSQFPNTEITITALEYASICPKTGLPDFGTLIIEYVPDKKCLELKSLKMYLLSYRNLGIFYENAVNCILRDLVKACKPVHMSVYGEFSNRGGIMTTVDAEYSSNQ